MKNNLKIQKKSSKLVGDFLEKYMPNYAFGNFPFKYEIYPDIYHNSLEVTIVLGDNNGK